ncbi:MAG: hypothetical protein RMN52_00790 [Anaerolineae bacterium]|nr:hypothetical protein [Candidatus Roseilinea sp.]MDW8448513.1 hypothetical protein [Anaerolineae bacterium]
MATDLALIVQIKQHDASALAELCDRYGARVYSLAYAILGRGDDCAGSHSGHVYQAHGRSCITGLDSGFKLLLSRI